MKLARKVALSLLVALLTVLFVRTWLVVDRTMRHLDADAREDQSIVVRAIKPAFLETWKSRGLPAARSLLNYTDERLRRVELRFLSPDQLATEPHIDAASLKNGREASFVAAREDGEESLATLTPVAVDGKFAGAIEASESLAANTGLGRAQLLDTLMTTVILVLVAFLLTSIVGVLLIGRPIERLVGEVRRIASGDLSQPIPRRTRDELGDLALEIDKMRCRVADAQACTERESRRRLDALEQLRHAERLTTAGKLAACVAHDLGTPLTIVGAHAKMIESDGGASEKARESARSIREQATRMTQMLRSLLDFTRRRKTAKTRVDLCEVVQSTVRMLEPLARTTQKSLNFRYESSPLYAEVDAELIEQALTNLITNAIDATQGSEPVSISVKRASEAEACVSVRDHGTGIPDELLPHLFEPFFTTKRTGRGTGLGLSIASEIALDHGGRIEVETQRAVGSCFSLVLPSAI